MKVTSGAKEIKEIKEMADTFRETASILDEVVANLQNEEIGEEEQEKKISELIGRFMWQMLKIQQMKE